MMPPGNEFVPFVTEHSASGHVLFMHEDRGPFLLLIARARVAELAELAYVLSVTLGFILPVQIWEDGLSIEQESDGYNEEKHKFLVILPPCQGARLSTTIEAHKVTTTCALY
jgi:hypothetical protein